MIGQELLSLLYGNPLSQLAQATSPQPAPNPNPNAPPPGQLPIAARPPGGVSDTRHGWRPASGQFWGSCSPSESASRPTALSRDPEPAGPGSALSPA